MCDDSVTRHFCDKSPTFVIVFASRDSLKWHLLMLASAKCRFCRHRETKVSLLTTMTREHGSRVFLWRRRPYARITRDWHLIGTIHFLSTDAFQPIRQFGRAITGLSQRRTAPSLWVDVGYLKWWRSLSVCSSKIHPQVMLISIHK